MSGLELLSDQGYRVDGRRAGELRKIQARMGVFAQADGSAYIEQGNTKALAVVYGPHEIRGSRARALPDRALVNCQYSSATFSTGERKRRPHGDRKSCEMGLQLRQTFEAAILTQLHPRSQIDIYVQLALWMAQPWRTSAMWRKQLVAPSWPWPCCQPRDRLHCLRWMPGCTRTTWSGCWRLLPRLLEMCTPSWTEWSGSMCVRPLSCWGTDHPATHVQNKTLLCPDNPHCTLITQQHFRAM
ncbi:exosome complex component RRP41 isoform X2 [Piliocolobus tephrosceles]|uniref:exosome complex component RRP41 isoform X2 n=1 Tax=Piliocolobus tephrosceles TaxID=591936 RepID=UPI000E6B2625|nr:exosome complex component RRP41 isoform X2 [Piliocolobus tephrosceles]